MTVRNVRTGQTGRTAALGSGIRRGRAQPAGHGRGRRQLRDHPHRHRLQGRSRRLPRLDPRSRRRRLPFNTAGHGADRAELFALTTPLRGARSAVAQAASSRVVPAKRRRSSGAFAFVRPSWSRRVRGSRAHPPRRRIVGRLRVHGRVGGAKARRGQNRRVAIQISRKGHWRTVGRARLRPRGRFSLQVRLVVHGRVRGLMLRAVDSSRALQGGAGAGATPELRILAVDTTCVTRCFRDLDNVSGCPDSLPRDHFA